MSQERTTLIVERPLFRRFLFAAFLLTGATGLVYQVLWARLLVLSFGYTIHSVSIVITAFMGGLALGSVIGGYLADRVKSPLIVYAIAEVGVGAIALATYPLLTGLPDLIASLREPLSIPYYGFSFWTFLVAMAILVPPATLMGMTLPLLARTLTATKERAAMDVGALYSFNTLGAAAGSLVAGFLLIAILGVFKTLALAALVNLLIGLLAFLCARGGTKPLPLETGGGVESTGDGPPTSSLLREPISWAFAASGFAALCIEVIWIRTFSPYLENSSYAFSLILAVFLAGIGLGAAALRKTAGKAIDAATGFAICQVLVGCATALGFLCFFLFTGHYYELLPTLGLLISNPFIIVEESVWIFLILLPSTFFMGAGFPFIARWAAGEFASLGATTGKLYAANTVGSILGSLAGGFVFFPLFGTSGSIAILASINLLNGFVLLYMRRRAGGVTFKAVAGASAVSVVLIMTLFFLPDPNLRAIMKAYEGHRLLAHREDPDVNVTLLESEAAGNKSRTLHLNLRNVSGTGTALTPWMAHLPLFLYEGEEEGDGPRRFLNIGLGIGHTFASALQHPDLDVEVVELIPSVADLFTEFKHLGERILENPRGSIIIGDGRNYLLSQKEPYDVIAIDPTPPLYGTGAVNLYTTDFYEIVMERLSPKGILLLRIPYSADELSVRLLIRATAEVFPHVSLWKPPFQNAGFSVIASRHTYEVDPAKLWSRVAGAPFLTGQIKEVLSTSQPVYLGEVREILDGSVGYDNVKVVTDDTPYLEFPIFH